MRSLTYAFLGPDDQAAKLAKKGTATDITLYNAKKGDVHLNVVTPSRFPEKIMSLLLALDMSNEVILQPAQIDRSLGETVVAAELLGRTTGFVRGGPNANLDQLRDLLAKTELRTLQASAEPEPVFRESLFERASPPPVEGPTVVAVDHSFPVKGVGTVVLGLVRRGEVLAHQTVQAYPTTKTCEVRTVQVHDVDHASAATNSRVGLAMKGAEPEDVGRGKLLAPPGSLKILAPNQDVSAGIQLSAFSKWQPRAGAVLHVFHALQDVVARVDAIGVSGRDANAKVRLEGPLALLPGASAILVDVDNKAQRLVGRIEFATA